MRLDQYLVKTKKIESRTKAQELIYNKNILVNNIIITKPSFFVSELDQVEIKNQEILKFVSRAGLKIEAAILKLNINLAQMSVLDIGQSTGGFTDCCLQMNAAYVVGIDVGEHQLHEKIKLNPKNITFEKLNVKNIKQHQKFQAALPPGGFDLLVCDVSFISLRHVVPYVAEYLKKDGQYLFLVKPQFECGPEHLDKNGIVKNKKVYDQIQTDVTLLCEAHLGQVLSYFESAVPGKEGNLEFFIYGRIQK
jgi:23S rRNA (cytidine1920-2'-O)/16S rRNA (cytidine1409-2'-O)-methyltransferase